METDLRRPGLRKGSFDVVYSSGVLHHTPDPRTKNALGEKTRVRGIIAAHLGVPAKKILFTEHHQSHAAAAFLTAPTARAAILTTDGVEWATLTAGTGKRRPNGATTIRLLREIHFPHSLGMLYSTFTAYLGFAVNDDWIVEG